MGRESCVRLRSYISAFHVQLYGWMLVGANNEWVLLSELIAAARKTSTNTNPEYKYLSCPFTAGTWFISGPFLVAVPPMRTLRTSILPNPFLPYPLSTVFPSILIEGYGYPIFYGPILRRQKRNEGE